MKIRRSTVAFLAVLFLAGPFLFGCSARMIRDESLVLEVIPLPVLRGKTGQVTVNAPMDAAEVIGKIKVTGSPEFIFEKDKKRKVWYFAGTIPFSPWVRPGKYTIRVIVRTPPEKDRYAEMEMELK